MPDPLFDPLYRDTEHLSWAPTADVRLRGRQRAVRQRVTMLAAGSVVAIAASLGALVALPGSDSGPTPPDVIATPPTPSTSAPTPSAGPTATATPSGTTPPTTPSRTADSGDAGEPADRGDPDPAIPAAAMLQVSDLPSGFRIIEPEFEGDGSLGFFSTVCGNDWTSGGPDTAERKRFFAAEGTGIDQRVNRYPRTVAQRYMSALRADVQGCRDAELTIADQGFAGQESMLVLSGDNGWILVRQGDLLTEITVDNGSDTAEARRLGARAAQRLCAGTDAC
ncbi:hypothetical protein [Plantactinospora sp. CA-290183]|uniref:hypothetical protein n=1 Tax=Plantactinospora sp. CA-290183 TaxID=3240006 RepID=UPI003D8D331D